MQRIFALLDATSERLRYTDTPNAPDWVSLQQDFDAIAEMLSAIGDNDKALQAQEIAAQLASGGKTSSEDSAAVAAARQVLADWEAALAAPTAQEPRFAYTEIEAQLVVQRQCDASDLIDLTDLEVLGSTLQEPAPPEENGAIVDAGLLEEFIREAFEHLESAEQELLSLENDPADLERLNAVFRAFHTIKGVAGFIGLETLAAVAHESENILDKSREGRLPLVGIAMDSIFTSVDTIKRLLAAIQAEGAGGDSRHRQDVSGLLQTLSKIASGELVSEAPAKLPEPSEENTPEATETAARPQANASNQAETLRVDRHRLDDLVDMIGELVIAESMVQQDLADTGHEDPHASRNLAQLNKITRNLQELSLSLRMVPIRATFQKMARLVRDLSKRMGKPVDFQMIGEDTELDKTVVDELSDPLMHMIRNAVDHGIEASPEERTAVGKEPRGKVLLKAYHQGGNIFVEIHDDGRGINPDKLHRKAIDLGIISPETKLPENELMQLIFHAGLSTAEKVTDVSGRGVGMDVVRRNIEALRGTVDVRSTPGAGTRFSIRLPLTLAIIDGMAVSVGQQRYILPTLSIVELICPKPEDIKTVREQGEYFQLRDQCIPLLRVDELLGQSPSQMQAQHQIIVVVDSERKRAGLLVDAVLGQHQAVIKTLGHSLEAIPGMSGGAVMPDGRVGLILDIHGLLEMHSPVLPGAREEFMADSSSVGSE